jgi:type VI protein secretion system component Hcp
MHSRAVVLLALIASALASATYIKITGRAQGVFYTADYANAKATINSYTFGVSVPVSVNGASGAGASGRRSYSTLNINKKISQMAPQIYQALLNNEPVQVVIETYASSYQSEPAPTLIERITLTNALVTNYQQDFDNNSGVEMFAFSFTQIQMQNSRYTVTDTTL